MRSIYGLEDYKISFLNYKLFTDGQEFIGSFRGGDYLYGNTFIMEESLVTDIIDGIVEDSYKIENDVLMNHTDLLPSVKKIYIHPSCSIPRTLVSTQYKKVLSPWQADAIIMPDISGSSYAISKWAVFIDNDNKIIYLSKVDKNSKKVLESIKKGEKLKDLIIRKDNCYYYGESINLETSFSHITRICSIYKEEECVADILVGKIPNNKIIYENSLMASLGNAGNKISYEELVSICEMLSSKDDDTVSAALKALSTLDYCHYENSVILVLSRTYSNYVFNKATKSTSVKYMFQHLNIKRGIFYFSGSIYAEDYSLFKKMTSYINKQIDEGQIFNSLKNYPFMMVTPEGKIVPNIKTSE